MYYKKLYKDTFEMVKKCLYFKDIEDVAFKSVENVNNFGLAYTRLGGGATLE